MAQASTTLKKETQEDITNYFPDTFYGQAQTVSPKLWYPHLKILKPEYSEKKVNAVCSL